MTDAEWKVLYNLSPELKVERTKSKFREFYHYFSGQVFISFSGGKDSCVLAHIVKSMGEPYSSTELVFFDTHNEDPTVYDIAEKYGATVISSLTLRRKWLRSSGIPSSIKKPLILSTLLGTVQNILTVNIGVSVITHSYKK